MAVLSKVFCMAMCAVAAMYTKVIMHDILPTDGTIYTESFL